MANAASDALSVIVNNISQLDSRTNEIAATSEEQAQATGIIPANVKEISELSKNVEDEVQNILGISTDLLAISKKSNQIQIVLR